MHDPVAYDQFLQEYLEPYSWVNHLYVDGAGWIVWRPGTGLNVELLHIRTFEPGRGYGRQLFYAMLGSLQEKDTPYHSVFGFTRVGNYEARRFYGALGFDLTEVEGVYQEGTAVLFRQSFRKLVRLMKEYQG